MTAPFYNYRNHMHSMPSRHEVAALREAYVPTVARSTPPAQPLQPSKYPHLKMITCEHGYGTLTRATCEARWRKANAAIPAGQGAIDRSAMQLSSCRRCEAGAERCGRKVPPRKVVAQDNTCACGEPCASHRTRCDACIEAEGERYKTRMKVATGALAKGVLGR